MKTPSSSFREVPRTGVIYVMAEAAARGFRYGSPDWCNLGQGAPEIGALPGSPPRVGAIELPPSTCEYSPVAGSLALREAVAQLYNHRYRKGRRSQYTSANVAISGGGRVALTRIAASLGRVNLGHLLPDYTAYEELLEVFRGFMPIPIVLRERDGWVLKVERLRELIVGSGLGALLVSNPCNPTGRLVQGPQLQGWVRACTELGCALILDEFYSHYVYTGAPGQTVSAAEHVQDVDRDPIVIVDGLTKNWRYPGWRLSWTLGPRHVIDRLSSAGSFLDGGPSHPIQQAALPLLHPDVAHQEAVAIQQVFSHKRAVMLERLGAMGIHTLGTPEGAFYCFVSLRGLPKGLNTGEDFFRACLDEQVICVPGEFFDVNPGKRRSHIPSRLKDFARLSFGPDLPTLTRGLDRMQAMVARG